MDISYFDGGERTCPKTFPKVCVCEYCSSKCFKKRNASLGLSVSDLSHSDTRLSVMLNGLEVHVYNRSEMYAKLERTFGLKPSILVPVRRAITAKSVPLHSWGKHDSHAIVAMCKHVIVTRTMSCKFCIVQENCPLLKSSLKFSMNSCRLKICRLTNVQSCVKWN